MTYQVVKTNAVIICDIDDSRNTADYIQYLINAPALRIVPIPEHKCCFVVFDNYADAIYLKTHPILNTSSIWGKELWMRDGVLRDDGIVEILSKDIPRDVEYNRDGTYRHLQVTTSKK